MTLELLENASQADLAFLAAEHEWHQTARPTQVLPLDGWKVGTIGKNGWTPGANDETTSTCIATSGRGFGKTRTGAAWIRRQTGLYPGSITHVVAPTYSDLRGVIFEGPSGLKASIPAVLIKSLTYSPYPEMVLWNGSIIRGFSSESPDRIRGPQCTFLWGDELAAWYRPEENLSNIDFSTRIAYKLPDGRLVQPQKFYTTTPRPLQWLAKMLKSSRVIRGSTYENKANLADAFFATLAQYEGTEIGRQELHGELLDISEAAIIKKSWLRMWPASDPLPWFEYIIVSLDTAFTEKSFDRKSFEADPSACSVWGVFKHDRRWNLLLLECWEKYLGFPDLVKEARKEMKAEYGRRTETIAGTTLVGQNYHRLQIKKPDLMVIEEKGSGISLRQMLSAEGIDTYPYSPGLADKLARLHAVSHLAHAGRIWLPEGARVNKTTNVRTPTGEFANWSNDFTDQLCTYSGPGTTKHDDFVDTCLVPETLVAMADGTEKRIDQVTVGDWVATQEGVGQVVRAGQTGEAEIYRAEWEGGTLEGSGTHPVWADGRWQSLDSLYHKAILASWHGNRKTASGSNPFTSTGTNTIDIPTPKNQITDGTIPGQEDKPFTEPYGNTITDLFLKDGSCITTTETWTTTQSETWSACQEAITTRNTEKSAAPVAAPSPSNVILNVSVEVPPIGIEAMRVGLGIANTPNTQSNGPALQSLSVKSSHSNCLAHGVAQSSKPGTSEPSIVLPTAKVKSRHSVVSVRSVSNTRIVRPVFNLTVTPSPTFYANGVLVHNCSQAWRLFADKFVSEGLDVKLPDGEVPSLPGTPTMPDPYAPRVLGYGHDDDDAPARSTADAANPYD